MGQSLEAVNNAGQNVQESHTIVVVFIDRFAAVATGGDVIQSTSKFESQGAWPSLDIPLRNSQRQNATQDPKYHVRRYHSCVMMQLIAIPIGEIVAAVTIRNLPDATHRALKIRAAQHGRSTEAEIRDILELAVNPPHRIKLGSELAAIGREFGGVNLDIERDKTSTEPLDFE